MVQEKPVIKKYKRIDDINGIKYKLCGSIYSSKGNLRCYISNIHTETNKPQTCKVPYREYWRIKHITY